MCFHIKKTVFNLCQILLPRGISKLRRRVCVCVCVCVCARVCMCVCVPPKLAHAEEDTALPHPAHLLRASLKVAAGAEYALPASKGQD